MDKETSATVDEMDSEASVSVVSDAAAFEIGVARFYGGVAWVMPVPGAAAEGVAG